MNDPVKGCDLYKNEGCCHVDGILCDYPKCSMLKEYIELHENYRRTGEVIMNDYQILHNAPEGATHFDGKTYFRFEMFEHGQAYLVLKNGVWDRGLPAYPVYSCRCLQDIKRLTKAPAQEGE